MYGKALLPLLLLVPPGEAHEAAMAALAPLEHIGPLRRAVRAWALPSDPRLVVEKMGLTFPTPVGLAGGFDKNAMRPKALGALGFGHIEIGTVTARAQEANPEPNMFRLPADRALINRLGFPNEGASRVVQRLIERGGARSVGVPVGISIGKSRAVPLDPAQGVIDDYLASFAIARGVGRLRRRQRVVAEHAEPARDAGAGARAGALSAIVRCNETEEGKRVPVLLKIAPDLTDEDSIAPRGA